MKPYYRTLSSVCAVLAVGCVLLAGCGRHTAEVDTVAYQQELDTWRATRLKNLTGPDGWTTLVGLYWLKPGDNRFGRDADNSMVADYPALPAHVGNFSLHAGRITFHAAPHAGVTHDGKPVTTLALTSDAAGDPTLLNIGSVSFFAIERVGHVGIRVKDSAADARVHFRGLQYFDADPHWRLDARFEPYRPMKKIPIINVLGMEENMDSPGALVFEVAGHSYRLDTVLEQGETDYFIMFADRSNGSQTYGAGRFLYVHPPVDGHTVLDFNKAYNPPCAFSRFATCPLPPPQNRLPIVVNAGELRYDGAGH
ncbi:MAG TPA: DUF1684 domain-containing protein [Gammaproteobacteria bacterium]|nr:DUF1684 domain-containing protein [Gammaproteobacteria bacterium]